MYVKRFLGKSLIGVLAIMRAIVVESRIHSKFLHADRLPRRLVRVLAQTCLAGQNVGMFATTRSVSGLYR